MTAAPALPAFAWHTHRRNRRAALARRLAGAAVLVALAIQPANAQDQGASSRAGWPCTGKIDPSYVRAAEATGGAVFLFRPEEVSGVGVELAASDRHEETVLRAGARVAAGVHEFDVPVDSTIRSVYFHISLQCLEFVTITLPSGDELRADAGGVDYHRFDAVHLLTVAEPSPGAWRVKVAGRGFLSVIVKAKSSLGLADVTFQEDGTRASLPKSVKRQRFEVGMRGPASSSAFEFLSGTGATLQRLDLTVEKESEFQRTHGGDVTPPASPFRVALTGVDARGFRFQRVHHQLFTIGP